MLKEKINIFIYNITKFSIRKKPWIKYEHKVMKNYAGRLS